MNDRRLPDPRPAAGLLASLGSAPVPEDGPATEARRRRIVHNLQGTIRAAAEARARAARRTRTLGVLAAAAIAALGVGGAYRLQHPRVAPAAEVIAAHLRESAGGIVALDARGATREVRADMSLDAGDTLATASEARARVVLESGVVLEVASATSLLFGEPLDLRTHADEQLDLRAGQVHFEVPARPVGATFRVLTPDVVIVVHGTSFVVSVCEACGGPGGNTAVKVTDGAVLVQKNGTETLVSAGEQWPARAAEDAPTPTAVSPSIGPAIAAPTGASSIARPHGAPSARPAGEAAAPRPVESTLAEQNRAYQGALEARRRGDDSRALGLLDGFLARYPASPLAQEARVERLRCLQKLGRSDAASTEARKYLVDYPDGFARKEAKERALPPSPPAGGKP